MMLVYYGFNDGSVYITQTQTKDGQTLFRTLEGDPGGYPQRRMVACVEVWCPDIQDGLKQMLAGIKELRKRARADRKTPARRMKVVKKS